jgi:ankyrin repeat protein
LLSQKDAPESLTRDAAGVALDALRSTLWGSLASPDWTEEEVEARRERTFQLLLANGLDPNTIVSSGAPLLALAVSGSHRCGPGVVATLIKYGADVNSVFVDESSQERTALDYATRDGRKDTIRALKSKGAKTRQQLRDG